MKPSGNSRKQQLVEKALQVRSEPDSVKKLTRGVLSERITAASTGAKTKRVIRLEIDPKRVRPWKGHNRDYGVLSESRCADLIEGFRQSGQQFPAIVRKVEDSAKHDYEFICGARRHWTASFLKRDLLIEVRDLDDKEAFILQDIENRDREDISDYERAIDYQKALPVYFEGVASRMAEELRMDKGNFSKLLALASVPEPIVKAYGDIRELVVRHGATYLKLCKDPKTKERLVKAAYKLHGQNLKGTDVLKRLKEAAMVHENLEKTNQFTNKFIEVKAGRQGEYSVRFKVGEKLDSQKIIGIRKSINAMLDELDSQDSEATTNSKNHKFISA